MLYEGHPINKFPFFSANETLLENFKWEIFTHPPYSPDLAPSDFHLFPALKLQLGGKKHFANDDEVQAEANHWLRRQDTAWYNSGIKKLLQRYQKCWDRNVWTVIEKQRVCIEFCLKLGKTASESFQMLKQAFKEDALSQSRTFEWFARFKAGRTSVKDHLHTGRPLSIRNPEKALKIKNPKNNYQRLSEDLDISFGTCQTIIKNDLHLKRSPAKFVPHLLTNEQKKHRKETCKTG
ncbi:hypothetical protein LAZ67_2003952 [Cordylochernes scorpioides]|uniref:Mos1 transposase HTH domain-containing protein n=1 Tax=Cordylochernes scorpioides TaxID=51811 RepID=A0ABY6K3H2_9ARAC|nr:hypothetical protein LAZ67_2003952 [Cordylochernes scorpioides]